MKFKILNEKDISDIAKIHLQAFPSSLLTKFGHELTGRYYLWQLISGDEVFPIGVNNDKNELIGFCFGGKFKVAFVGFVLSNKTLITKSLLRNPSIVFNYSTLKKIRKAIAVVIKYLINKLNKRNNPRHAVSDNNFGILAIAVDPSYKRKGIGKFLIKESENIARKQGFKKMFLTVSQKNFVAIEFYRGIGWIKSLTNENWNGGMEKELNDFSNK